MSNGLSQAEIDALLKGEQPLGGDPSADEGSSDFLSSETSDFAAQSADMPQNMSEEDIAALFAATGSDAQPVLDPSQMGEENLDRIFSSREKEFDSSIKNFSNIITPMETDAMGEIGNISMGTSATTLFALLNRRVDITTPRVVVTTMAEIARVYPLPFVAVEVKYTVGLEGTNILFLKEKDVKIITDLMLGGDGTNTEVEFTEMHLSCISEVMNQMMGSSATSLAKMLNTAIDISPPLAYRVDLGDTDNIPFANLDDHVVRIGFSMVVEGLINSEIMQVTPVRFAKAMVRSLLGEGPVDVIVAQPPLTEESVSLPQQQDELYPSSMAPIEPQQQPPQYQQQESPPQYQQQAPPPQYQQQTPPPQYQQQAPPPQYQQQAPPPQYQQQTPPPQYQQQTPPPQYPSYPYPPQYPDPYGNPYYQGYGYPPPPPQMPQQPPQPAHVVDVRPMQFNSFGDSAPNEMVGENMDLLMDIPLQVSVELGKTRKYIKEILDFNIGTIVELDKMAGELVDVIVNGKLIAKGEVVVIDENYGCRITDIVSPSKRINQEKQ